MKRGFFSHKLSEGGRGVKEKNSVSDNVVAKDVAVPNVVDEPVLSSMGGLMAHRVTGSSNSSRTHDNSTATPVEGNGVDVAVLLDSIRAVSKRFANLAYGFFLGKRVAYPVVANYFSSMDGLDAILDNGPWSSYARAMIELRADVELKDTIMVFGHVLDECPKNIISDLEKNLKNPRQATRGVQVGTNVAFKPLKQVYRPVSNRNNASSSGKKKQAVVTSKESAGKGPNSDWFSLKHKFFNATSSSTSTTHIVERIYKIERQIIDEKITLVDDDGNPLPKIISTKNVDSDNDSDVEDVVDDHAVFMASTCLKCGADSGYDTNSLLE
ncbi:hypothetical protein Tco_0904032 [Tanacetum coccineum]